MDRGTIEKLVAQVQQGQQAAFETLYNEFADRIFVYLKCKVTSTEHAEDLLQEVFVKAWHGIPKLPLENLNFSAWLYRIATNTLNDHFRKTYRRPQTVSLDESVEIASIYDSSREAEQTFTKSHITEALATLPSHYKQVLELRFIQELSIKETAKAMGKTSVSVRVLQHRAIKQLEQIFKQS